MQHPSQVLFEAGPALPTIPACEHFAGNEKFINKAIELQASSDLNFDITCDCEDGAPSGKEEEHAQMVAKIIAGVNPDKHRMGVRIHDPLHQHCKNDIDILLTNAGNNIAYLTIPKPLGYSDAAKTVDYARQVADKAGVALPPIHILIETQSALAEVFEIAEIPGLQGIVFGLLDFVSDHQGVVPSSTMRSPGQFSHRLITRAKAEITAAALKNGLVATHNPCLEIKDESVPREDARIAREEYGFMRMYSIHPGQIRPIIESMQPNQSEIVRASEILLAAQQANWGPISHNGEMHDRASYRYFWNILKQAKTTSAALSEAVENAFFKT